eukprot:7384471-Prymnesium_polylepis.1
MICVVRGPAGGGEEGGGGDDSKAVGGALPVEREVWRHTAPVIVEVNCAGTQDAIVRIVRRCHRRHPGISEHDGRLAALGRAVDEHRASGAIVPGCRGVVRHDIRGQRRQLRERRPGRRRRRRFDLGGAVVVRHADAVRQHQLRRPGGRDAEAMRLGRGRVGDSVLVSVRHGLHARGQVAPAKGDRTKDSAGRTQLNVCYRGILGSIAGGVPQPGSLVARCAVVVGKVPPVPEAVVGTLDLGLPAVPVGLPKDTAHAVPLAHGYRARVVDHEGGHRTQRRGR